MNAKNTVPTLKTSETLRDLSNLDFIKRLAVVEGMSDQELAQVKLANGWSVVVDPAISGKIPAQTYFEYLRARKWPVATQANTEQSIHDRKHLASMLQALEDPIVSDFFEIVGEHGAGFRDSIQYIKEFDLLADALIFVDTGGAFSDQGLTQLTRLNDSPLYLAKVIGLNHEDTGLIIGTFEAYTIACKDRWSATNATCE